MSCNSGHGQSIPVTNGFHSPTLICSDPNSLVFPSRLNPIDQSGSWNSSRYSTKCRRGFQSSSLNPDVSSRYCYNSPRGYGKLKKGGNDLQVKIPRKKVRFAIPASPRKDKSMMNGISYNAGRNYCKTPETPWAAPLNPEEQVDIIYAQRSRESNRWR